MKTMSLSSSAVTAIAVEHKLLGAMYERIIDALHAGPRKLLDISAMLDELIECIAEHFAHEEEGGYYSEIAELAPWLSTEVEELKREHSDLLSCAVQIGRNARIALGSERLCDDLRREFAEFLRRCGEHEATENRLVQEGYSLDIAAAD